MFGFCCRGVTYVISIQISDYSECKNKSKEADFNPRKCKYNVTDFLRETKQQTR